LVKAQRAVRHFRRGSPARLLKIDDRLGTLEEKKLADVVAVEGNSLEDIRAMHRVVFVMPEGVVFKNP
jgi:imidazolonepropionase-like amidohydrolase